MLLPKSAIELLKRNRQQDLFVKYPLAPMQPDNKRTDMIIDRSFDMERLTYFVSSRGLMKACPIRNAQPKSSNSYLDENFLDTHHAGDAIYVCTDALQPFANNFLSKISSPFVLVTGDSDTLVDTSFIGKDCIASILKSQYLIHWYAQNLVADHHKLIQIPIGMDYHTMWDKPGYWGMAQQSPIAQEQALLKILSCSPAFEDRLFMGYCNWQFEINRGDRKECFKSIIHEICFLEKNHIPRVSSWQRQSQCMFVISPEGAGIDCHRTWEALLLGCVPVLKKSRFTELFESLPIVLLDDWADFNPEFMAAHVDRLKCEKFDFSKLFNAYWSAQFTQKNRFILPPMTLYEFRQLVCRESV